MSHFFAYLSRMKYILRWGLMRNTRAENIQEHSLQVAMVAHSLALIKNALYGGQVNPDRVMVLAAYHEAGEVITGDLATPIKYFNPEIKQAYKAIERVAHQKLLDMLPRPLGQAYASVLFPQQEESDLWHLVKAADKICAYVKCIEELKAGNQEFAKAERAIHKILLAYSDPEVHYFIDTFIPSFHLTLDELN